MLINLLIELGIIITMLALILLVVGIPLLRKSEKKGIEKGKELQREEYIEEITEGMVFPGNIVTLNLLQFHPLPVEKTEIRQFGEVIRYTVPIPKEQRRKKKDPPTTEE